MDHEEQELAQVIRRYLGLSLFFVIAGAAAPAAAQSAGADVVVTADEAFRLSQTHAVAGNPKAALDAIERALGAQPDNAEYLRARATLATWAGDYRRAQDSYRRLAAMEPHNPEIALSYARVGAWRGDTDRAVRAYRQYLRARPDNPAVWIELARTESWRGNFAAAVETLDQYRRRFGESPDRTGELAAALTGGGRPRQAQALLIPLLQHTPNSYELSLTRTISLAMQQRPGAALESLDRVRRLAPGRPETRSAEGMLRTLLASTAEAPLSVYGDSDHLRTQRFTPRMSLRLRSGTELSAGRDDTRLDAARGSGLERPDGHTSAAHVETWVSLSHTVGGLTFGGQGGHASTDARGLNTYAVSLDTRAGDTLRLSVQRSFGYFVISPRTVGLGLTQSGERAQVDWTPTLRSRVVFDVMYQNVSDGNRRWAFTLSPRRSVARTARLNLDVGASVYWLATERDLDNGYYDPRRYENYGVTAYPYIKFKDNIGLGATLGLGVQRDAHSPGFALGGTASAEATFGIYEPWVLKVTTSTTINRRLDTGAFRGMGSGVALVRRF